MYEELVKRLRDEAYAPYHTVGVLLQAADAIEELQQTVDHYKGCSDDWYKEACDYKAAAPKWIPVTERLPENGERALVMRFDYVTNTPFYDLLWFDKGEWWNRLYTGNYAVTHWMPLPEPPKGE